MCERAGACDHVLRKRDDGLWTTVFQNREILCGQVSYWLALSIKGSNIQLYDFNSRA